MDKFRIELIPEGVRELLKSPEIMAACAEQAQAIANRAGTGYTVSTYTGRSRVNASVGATSEEALRDNYENNTLLKAVR